MSDPNSVQLNELYNALNIIVDVLLALSLFGCVGTVLTFTIFHELRTYPIKLIIYLCIAIFWAQLFFYLTFADGIYNSIMCIPAAMLLHYFFVADFLWTFCIAFNFYQMIVRRNRDAESLERVYHIISWIAPLIIVVFIASFHSYNNAGGYCYMVYTYPIFLGFFLPGLIIVSANAVIFGFIAREIHDTLKSAPKADKKEKSKEVRVYFSIFASIGLSWIFGFIMTFLDDQETLKIIFLVLFEITTPLQGFLIFVSYCVNLKVVSRWAQLMGRAVPVFRRWENLGTTSVTSSTASSTDSSTNRKDRSSHGSTKSHGGHSSTSSSTGGYKIDHSRGLKSSSQVLVSGEMNSGGDSSASHSEV